MIKIFSRYFSSKPIPLSENVILQNFPSESTLLSLHFGIHPWMVDDLRYSEAAHYVALLNKIIKPEGA